MTEKINIIDNDIIRVTKDVSDPNFSKYTLYFDQWCIDFDYLSFLKVALIVGGIYTEYKQFRICHRFGKYERMAKQFNKYKKFEENAKFKNDKM